MPQSNVGICQSIPCLPRRQRGEARDFSCRSTEREWQGKRPFRHWLLLATFSLLLHTPSSAQTITFLPYLGSPAGLFFAGGSADFGNVDALGIGTPSSGLTRTSISGGQLYQTPYVINVVGTPSTRTTVVRAYVSANGNPTVLQAVSSYPGTNPCPTTGYTTLPSSPEADVIPITGVTDGSYNACVGLIVNVANGASAVAGSYSVTITFDVYNYQASNGKLRLGSTTNLTLSVKILTAARLLLGSSGAFAITATGGTPDFTANFGNVNALGIGPGPGLSTLPSAGGMIYWTPYLITPSFSGFASPSGTVQVYVSSNFIHSTVLSLDDAASGTGPFNAIGNSGLPTTITSSAATGVNITRYLGLFVSNTNGAGSYRGNDSATLTYTLTVP